MDKSFDMLALRDLLDGHLDDAVELAEQHGSPLSAHRYQALSRVSMCGDPFGGFVWLRCEPCGADRVVATSCKTRVICPRCGGRRLAATAAHLVERVLPDQRLRQWVVTFPQPLPRMLAWHPELLERVLGDLSRVLGDDLRARCAQPGGHSGMVSLIQNFTSDLRSYQHIHALVPDGIFVQDGERVRFVGAPIPTGADIQRIAEQLARRINRSCSCRRS